MCLCYTHTHTRQHTYTHKNTHLWLPLQTGHPYTHTHTHTHMRNPVIMSKHYPLTQTLSQNKHTQFTQNTRYSMGKSEITVIPLWSVLTHTHTHTHTQTQTHTHTNTHQSFHTDTHNRHFCVSLIILRTRTSAQRDTNTHGATHCFREREVLLTHTHTLIVEKDIVLLQYSWAVGLIKFIDPNDPLSHLPFSFSMSLSLSLSLSLSSSVSLFFLSLT